MEIKEILTIVTLLAVYLGYAGVLGALIALRQAQSKWFAAFFALLIVLPASLALPWDFPDKLCVWGLASGIVILFAVRPEKLPGWLWDRRFALGYFGIVMLLILAWTVTSGHPLLWMWIGLPAFCVGFFVLQRAFQYR